MDSIIIRPVIGLYDELYNPNPSFASEDDSYNINSTAIFWDKVLAPKTIEYVLREAPAFFNYSKISHLPYTSALSNPVLFKNRVLKSKKIIADQGINPQRFFACIETLNIYCRLYAAVLGGDIWQFSIQNGWHLQEDSSQEMYQNCLNPSCNPYLPFIKEIIIPLVIKQDPHIVFLAGRPGFFAFALARLIKQINPSICICITRHSSEYYSLNKIDSLLIKNTYLFQSIDAVILEHFESVEKQVVETILKSHSLQNVNNLIYKDSSGDIYHTGYKRPADNSYPSVQLRSFIGTNDFSVPPRKVTNVHLFPYVKCYWNKCSFCGINQKYHFETPYGAYGKLFEQLKHLKKCISDSQYLWFIDEALPPDVLANIARFFIRELPDIKWQARCRIEQRLLTDGLPELLAKSGLKELRLGLESGSLNTLRRMNKFENTFSFSLVYSLCNKYEECGISLHFPMIIGFPGELDSDRQASYLLLRDLVSKYPSVSFNINIYGLDIASRVFRSWREFNVQSIEFPCKPSYYLGNMLSWKGMTRTNQELTQERDSFMREILYPWMPIHSITKPHVLYRLSETIRNTLVWKTNFAWCQSDYLSNNSVYYRRGDLSVIWVENKNLYYIYSWNSHHYMIGNQRIVCFLESFETSRSITEAVTEFCQSLNMDMNNAYEDLTFLVARLISYQFLIPDDENCVLWEEVT